MQAETESNPPRGRPPYGIYAYTARESDPEINLYYYRARYYDPKVGRFISEDPIGFRAGPNFYEYVGGNPIARRDPDGLCECGPECASGNWIIDVKEEGVAGAAFGSYAAGAIVNYGTIRCMENPTITRGVKITCKIIHGFFLGAGVTQPGSFTTAPDFVGKKCPEDLEPYVVRAKFFSAGPVGGSAPMGRKLPTTLSFGGTLGFGVGMTECLAEPR